MTLENAKYLLDVCVHYGLDENFERVCSSQQYRSVRGMLNSGCFDAEKAGMSFVTDCMYDMYSTDKARFMFCTDRGGWHIVTN